MFSQTRYRRLCACYFSWQHSEYKSRRSFSLPDRLHPLKSSCEITKLFLAGNDNWYGSNVNVLAIRNRMSYLILDTVTTGVWWVCDEFALESHEKEELRNSTAQFAQVTHLQVVVDVMISWHFIGGHFEFICNPRVIISANWNPGTTSSSLLPLAPRISVTKPKTERWNVRCVVSPLTRAERPNWTLTFSTSLTTSLHPSTNHESSSYTIYTKSN